MTLSCGTQGQSVVRFRVASTPRFYDKASGEWKDGESLFLICQAWRQAAENAAESLNRGASGSIVQGRLRQRSYEAKDGSGKRAVYELDADEIGVSLKNATAKVTKASRSSADNGGQRQAEPDPWASDAPRWLQRGTAFLIGQNARDARPDPARAGVLLCARQLGAVVLPAVDCRLAAVPSAHAGPPHDPHPVRLGPGRCAKPRGCSLSAP